MPSCARCLKTQATAELTRRRLNGAWTCKDAEKCRQRALGQIVRTFATVMYLNGKGAT